MSILRLREAAHQLKVMEVVGAELGLDLRSNIKTGGSFSAHCAFSLKFGHHG